MDLADHRRALPGAAGVLYCGARGCCGPRLRSLWRMPMWANAAGQWRYARCWPRVCARGAPTMVCIGALVGARSQGMHLYCVAGIAIIAGARAPELVSLPRSNHAHVTVCSHNAHNAVASGRFATTQRISVDPHAWKLPFRSRCACTYVASARLRNSEACAFVCPTTSTISSHAASTLSVYPIRHFRATSTVSSAVSSTTTATLSSATTSTLSSTTT